MTRLEAIIEEVEHCQALESHSNLVIAIVTRILSAEPTDEEIGNAASAYAKDQFDNQEDNIGCCKESMKAAIMAVSGWGRL